MNSTLGSVVPLAMFLFLVFFGDLFSTILFCSFLPEIGIMTSWWGVKQVTLPRAWPWLSRWPQFFEVLQCWQQHSIITLLMNNFTTTTKPKTTKHWNKNNNLWWRPLCRPVSVGSPSGRKGTGPEVGVEPIYLFDQFLIEEKAKSLAFLYKAGEGLKAITMIMRYCPSDTYWTFKVSTLYRYLPEYLIKGGVCPKAIRVFMRSWSLDN